MFNKKTIFKGDKKGFTLIELLIAIAIIAVLASIAAAAVQYARGQAKIARAQSDIAEIYKAMQTLSNDTGAWPGNQTADAINLTNGNEICGACTVGLNDPAAGLQSTDGSFENWSGPYMNEVPLDPWGNEYFFDTDYRVSADNKPCPSGTCFDAVSVGSYGPDGTGNNLYNEDDIIKVILK
jgi:general secretion pathway protein G